MLTSMAWGKLHSYYNSSREDTYMFEENFMAIHSVVIDPF